MDGSSNNRDDDNNNNNNHNGSKRMSRADYARNIRATMDERLQLARQFEPQIHEQVQRLFRDYQPPLHARLRGFGRAHTLALAESTALSLAAVNGRGFDDAETQALTEHVLAGVHNLLAWKWVMTGLAAYMTYRGRRTWRFPFFTPEFKRFSPIGADPKIQYLWHGARFGAYYGAMLVLVEPLFQGANFMRQRSAMVQDPRLRALLHDRKAQGTTLLEGGSEAGQQISDTWDSASQESSRQPEQDPRGPQTQSAWASYRSPASSQPQQRSDAWDSLPDGFDDASPISPASRGQQPADTNAYGGSAWDRLRQQAQYQPNQQQQDHRSWEKPQSGGGWGTDSDAKPQHQAPGDSYSFSNADKEKSLAKEQAQREFDRLLERERHGTEQDRSSWSRR